MSTATTLATPPAESAEDDTVELHVRNVPRSVWLKARQAALASRLRFGRYVIRLLENAGPLPQLSPVEPVGELALSSASQTTPISASGAG